MSCFDCYFGEKNIKMSDSGLPLRTYMNCWCHSNGRYQGGAVPDPDQGCEDHVSEDAFFAKKDAEEEGRMKR